MILSMYGSPTLKFSLKNSFVWRAVEVTLKIAASVAATNQRCIDVRIAMVLNWCVVNVSYTYTSGSHITESRYDSS